MVTVGGRAVAGLQGALGDQAGVRRPVGEAGIGDWGHLVPINRRRYKCVVFAVVLLVGPVDESTGAGGCELRSKSHLR